MQEISRTYLHTYPGLKGSDFSFWAGFSRVFDPFGFLAMPFGYRLYRTAEEADAAATASDWEAVGMDLWIAAGTLRRGPQEAAQRCKNEIPI